MRLRNGNLLLGGFLKKTFYFEIITDSQEVTDSTEKSVVLFTQFPPQLLHA